MRSCMPKLRSVLGTELDIGPSPRTLDPGNIPFQMGNRIVARAAGQAIGCGIKYLTGTHRAFRHEQFSPAMDDVSDLGEGGNEVPWNGLYRNHR